MNLLYHTHIFFQISFFYHSRFINNFRTVSLLQIWSLTYCTIRTIHDGYPQTRTWAKRGQCKYRWLSTRTVHSMGWRAPSTEERRTRDSARRNLTLLLRPRARRVCLFVIPSSRKTWSAGKRLLVSVRGEYGVWKNIRITFNQFYDRITIVRMCSAYLIWMLLKNIYITF